MVLVEGMRIVNDSSKADRPSLTPPSSFEVALTPCSESSAYPFQTWSGAMNRRPPLRVDNKLMRLAAAAFATAPGFPQCFARMGWATFLRKALHKDAANEVPGKLIRWSGRLGMLQCKSDLGIPI